MNPTSSTLKFVGVAAVSAVLAYGAWLGTQPSDIDGFSEVGQEFFPDFDDVAKATALTVTDFNDDDKDIQTFSVKQNDNGLWVIPSHHDYPAEAEDRLAKSATSLLGVKKIAVKSRSKDDWKRFGVVDPSDEGAATPEERGQRLTLSDGSGNPLVDLIIGNEVEGQENQFHVREPEKNTTYIAELDVDLSAKFSDWIEPDLLKIDSASDIIKLTLDNYSIDETQGLVKKTELLEFAKKDLETSGDWTLADLNEEKEELDSSPVQSIATNLNDLKIVGVRPKPEGLGDDLRVNPVVKQILQQQMQSLGYFIGGDKDGKERLYSNEGELIAGTDDGVEYSLFFGEIARGSGEDIEVGAAGGNDADAGEGDDAADEADEKEDGPRRYLLIKVGFNESLLGEKPVAPEEPVKPKILKEEAAKEEAETDKAKSESPDEKSDETEDAAKADKAADETEKQTPTNIETPDEEENTTTDEEASSAEEKEAETADSKSEDKEPANAKDTSKTADEKSAAGETEKTEDKTEDAKPSEKTAEPTEDPKEVAQKTYDAALKKYEADKKAYEGDLKKFEDRVKDGKEKVEELSLRFGDWYYVISSDSFEKFRVTRKDVIKEKADEKEAADNDSADGESK